MSKEQTSMAEQRSATLKKRINVVGAVLTRGNTILAAQRSSTMSLSGMWEFPGGKIEPHELPKEALIRELKEELLCTAEIGNLVQTTEHEYEFGTVILTTFYCSLICGEPKLTEHSEIRWVQVADLDQLNWAPADIPAVMQVMRDFQV
jgi:8-oxo-dGTP diphosphatase